MPCLLFHEAFDSLQKQILVLAEEFCSDCPSQVPNEVAQSIPSNLPSFLVDTPAAARVRLAYIQGLVSNIINRRIFQHFLFTYDHFDDIFNAWGDYLRSKSTKREAFWRQRTLHAAFSCPGSKERINKFARSIIEEVMTAIKPFANRSKREEMLNAVKQIVKTAAETWRYARIELSRISASPATDTSEGHEEEPLLSIFPRIEREPLPNDFYPDKKGDGGCVYCPGQTLSQKSTAVLARRVELGEISAMPVSAQREEELRPEYKRPRRMSSDIANRARKFEPRPTSPLIPSIESAQGSREKAVTLPTEVPSVDSDEQHGQPIGWRTKVQHGDHDQNTGYQTEREDAGIEDGGPAASQDSYGSAAASSPLQSPAHSRAQSPQLSRRTTATTESEDEGDSEMTTRPEKIPDWGGVGGNVPGAFGTQDGW
ncbi:MAG: hypothetical protein Q9225_002105 [Loekoesia sp. 1 TL-2023]